MKTKTYKAATARRMLLKLQNSLSGKHNTKSRLLCSIIDPDFCLKICFFCKSLQCARAEAHQKLSITNSEDVVFQFKNKIITMLKIVVTTITAYMYQCMPTNPGMDWILC